MITIIIIIVILYFIFKEAKPDEKNEFEIRNAIEQLPNFTLVAKRANFFQTKGECIDVFKYNDGILYLSLQNGKTLRAPLGEFTFKVEKCPYGELQVTANAYGKKATFMVYDYFTDDEWSIIYNVMGCAGKTYNISYLGNKAKIERNAAIGQVAKLVFQMFK